MNKIYALGFLVLGIVLMMLGYEEAHTLKSGVVHLFTGSPSGKSVWMMIAGVIAAVAGLLGLARSSK